MTNNIKEYLKQNISKDFINIKYEMAEIVQKIILSYLSINKFFDSCAFIGGTALRIFYNLDRFSEDLDFSLVNKAGDFDFEQQIKLLEKNLTGFGLNFKHTPIKSNTSVLKTTLVTSLYDLVNLLDEPKALKFVPRGNETLKIKIELDTNPPKNYKLEQKLLFDPVFAKITLFDIASLFSTKLNAILTRPYSNMKPKGRDYYDYLFYLSKKVSPNYKYLQYSLAQFQMWDINKEMNQIELKKLLKTNFLSVDIDNIVKDVKPLIKNVDSLTQWSNDTFVLTLDNLK